MTAGCSSHPSRCLRTETLATAAEVLLRGGSKGEVLCNLSTAACSSSLRLAASVSVEEHSSSSLCTCPG